MDGWIALGQWVDGGVDTWIDKYIWMETNMCAFKRLTNDWLDGLMDGHNNGHYHWWIQTWMDWCRMNWQRNADINNTWTFVCVAFSIFFSRSAHAVHPAMLPLVTLSFTCLYASSARDVARAPLSPVQPVSVNYSNNNLLNNAFKLYL